MSSRANAAAGSRGGAGLTVALALGGLVALALVFAFWQTPKPLHRTATGHQGLVAWLEDQGAEAELFRGGWRLRPETAGLRILPLFDSHLLSRDAGEEDQRAMEEYDIAAWVVRRKIASLDTLLILPKWQRVVRQRGIAHESLLGPMEDAARPLRQLEIKQRLIRPGRGYQTFAATIPDAPMGLEAGLYAPQLFARSSNPACTSWIGGPAGDLLLVCEAEERRTAYLSDPDLLNNHGLNHADNARIALALGAALAGDGQIVVDYTNVFLPPRDDSDRPERSWSELLRFFDWPLSLLWIGAGLLLLLSLWRSGIRFGSALRPFEDEIRPTKAVSVGARARLLRLAGADAELLRAYARTRASVALSQLYGGAGRRGGADPIAALASQAAHLKPEAAEGLRRAAAEVGRATSALGGAEILRRLHTFETAIEQILHDLRRPSNPR
ncbi:MAG: hypothetical protein AAGE18_10500 [Pseudomonadota bacterium]